MKPTQPDSLAATMPPSPLVNLKTQRRPFIKTTSGTSVANLKLYSLLMILHSIVIIILGQLVAARPPSYPNPVARPRTPVPIDEANWKLLLEGEWMLQLYVPSCLACRRFEPDWRRLAESASMAAANPTSDDDESPRGQQQQHLSRLGVASADVTTSPAMMTRFMIKSLPTIYHVKDGVFRLYTGPYVYANLVKFVEDLEWQRIDPAPLNIGANQSRQPTTGPVLPSRPALQQQQQQQQQQFGMMPGNKFPLSLQQQALNNPYTNATHAILLDLRQQLLNRQMKFHEHFKNLLSQSKISLHSMFVTTYGMMYEHNTEIFTNMYESLEQYYDTGRVGLTKSMENFFQRLYQKIFQVANSNRAFAPAYLECVSEQMTNLKPFKDAPEKLIIDIRHALVAARTFNQALNSAMDIIKNIITLGDPPQCINLISEKLLRNQPQPAGVTTREFWPAAKQPPCSHFCEQVILRCVGRGNLEPLAERWKSYMIALADLAKKLTVQYNIETIIRPIDVQISEAIMNFQENAVNITERVYEACGEVKPNNGYPATSSNLQPMRTPVHNGLGKREAIAPKSSALVGSLSYRQHLSQSPSSNGGRQSQPAGLRHGDGVQSMVAPTSGVYGEHGAVSSPRVFSPASLSANHMITDHQRPRSNGIHGQSSGPISQFDSYDAMSGSQQVPSNRKSPVIIGEIRDYLLSTKNFWASLPNSVCNMTLGANSSSSNNLRRNSQQCFQETLEVYDMNSDLRYRQEIQNQIQRLDSMNSKISDALQGVEIDWSKVSDISGAPIVPLDPQHPSAKPQPMPRPSPSIPSLMEPQPGRQDTEPLSEDDETDTNEEDPDDPGSGRDPDDPEDPDYPPSPDDFDNDPTEEDPLGPEDDSPSTTQSTDTAIDPSPIPNSGESNDIVQTPSSDLITFPREQPKSGSIPSGSLVVIDEMSLLLVSIIYCACSVVIQNQFRPARLGQAGGYISQ